MAPVIDAGPKQRKSRLWYFSLLSAFLDNDADLVSRSDMYATNVEADTENWSCLRKLIAIIP